MRMAGSRRSARKYSASAADLKFLQRLPQTRLGTSNRKAALESYRVASAPLLPKFVSEVAAMYHELRKRGTRPRLAAALACALAAASVSSDRARADDALRPYTVVGDAIPAPLTGVKGDSARGRTIVGNRQVGLCLLCHSGPFPEEKFQGTLAPNLSGAGTRWSEGQLR